MRLANVRSYIAAMSMPTSSLIVLERRPENRPSGPGGPRAECGYSRPSDRGATPLTTRACAPSIW